MKDKKLIIALLTVIAFAVTFFTVFAVLKYNESIDEEIEVAELDSVYISQDSTVAQLETPLGEEVEIEEKTNPSKTGELAVNESRKILNFEDDLSEEEITELEEQYDVEFTEDTSVKGTYSVVVKETSDLDALSKEEKVTGVETDVPVKMFADTVDWGVVRIGADKVWESSSGTGVKVAIIDTGIQTTHPDLSANIAAGYDFVNNDTSAMDDNGHGTHVAGIVASTMNG
ncbi:MAG: Subtilisin, partial [candidate division WS6 bacterium 34_10]